MENALYLIQVSACTSVFYVLYVAFPTFDILQSQQNLFARSTGIFIYYSCFGFFKGRGRLSSIGKLFSQYKALPILNNIKPESLDTMSGTGNVNFILLIYWAGFGFMMLRLVYSIARLTLLKTRAGISRNGAVRIVRTDLPQPFSFFNLIFLPNDEVNPLIVEHEKAHVCYHHWVDLLMLEISSAILWFNPLMIFYKKSIKLQHEYEADDHVIRNGSDIPHYLDCILHHLQTENFGIPISQFYSQNIKKRIIMMTRKKTPLRFSCSTSCSFRQYAFCYSPLQNHLSGPLHLKIPLLGTKMERSLLSWIQVMEEMIQEVLAKKGCLKRNLLWRWPEVFKRLASCKT